METCELCKKKTFGLITIHALPGKYICSKCAAKEENHKGLCYVCGERVKLEERRYAGQPIHGRCEEDFR